MEGIVASLFAGWTPLHVAAEGGREAVVEVLLRHNADPSLVTDTGLFYHDSLTHFWLLTFSATRPRPAFGRLGLGGSSGGYGSHE